MRSNLKAYQKINRESGLAAADPHAVILILFDGLLENMSIAKGAIERKDFALKSNALTKAINILRSLQDSLDFDSEPAISDNFNALYDYCIVQLTDASVLLDVKLIDHTTELLLPLRDAWRGISEQDKQEGFTKLHNRSQTQVSKHSVGT